MHTLPFSSVPFDVRASVGTLNKDIEENIRPQGTACDFGPYEYLNSTKYVVSGNVSDGDGSAMGGVIMQGLPGNPSTEENGYCSETVPSGWSGTVKPCIANFHFMPSSKPYTNIQSNQSQDYTGEENISLPWLYLLLD